MEGALDPEKGKEERALALLEEDVRSEYRNCRSCFRIGTPFEQIVHEAENVKASLIVMSSHSYGWLDRIVHRERRGNDTSQHALPRSCRQRTWQSLTYSSLISAR